MSDQVPHLVMQSDEEMYLKLQEWKEKVVSLKESNKIIESRLDALCVGVEDCEQTPCPECKRERDDEAEVMNELKEGVKTLEEQERHKEDEMKKLGESLKTVIKNFDKLLETAQAKKISSQSGNKSRQDQRVFATVNSEINGDSRFEKEGSSLQDITQADHVLPIGMNTDNEMNCDDEHKQGSYSGNQTESTQIKQKLSTTSDPKMSSFPGVKTLSESGQEIVTRQTGSTAVVSKNQQTKMRNEVVDQSTNQQNVVHLTEVVDHSQHSRSTRERYVECEAVSVEGIVAGYMKASPTRPVSSVHASRGTDSVTASLSEIYKVQTPGPQQTVNHEAKVTSSDKDSNRVQKVEITGDIFQEAEGPVKDAKARDAVKSVCTENSYVEEDLHLTKSSIKNPNFQRKPRSFGSKESQQHQQFDESRKYGYMDIYPASTVMKKQNPEIKIVDLDKHAPIVQVPDTEYWVALAQTEHDKACKMIGGKVNTVLCVDTSASMRQGSAWEQTKQFFNQFITGLEEVRKECNFTKDHVAISVFGEEVRVIQRLTDDFSMLRQAFDTLKVGGPSGMYGGLLMALAGVEVTSHVTMGSGMRVLHRIILISDGKPTDPLLASGPDVYNTEEKKWNQDVVLKAVKKSFEWQIRIHCVPVGDADVKFLQTIAKCSYGKVFSIEDGRKLARKTINTFYAGFLLKHRKMVNNIHSTKFTLDEMMFAVCCNKELLGLSTASQIASLSTAEKAEVLEIAKEALAEDLLIEKGYENLFIEREDAMEKYHYEFDDPDVKLPPLGTRVRRGPDWDKGLQDFYGPGTILGHHKDQRHVCVEWDRNINMNFYRYGDMGKYDVIIVDDPRLLDLTHQILTGCHVKRGKDWMYGNLGGTPDAVGVVLKVLEEGRVVVRWPDKSKNVCRFGSEGFFDLEICNPSDGQTGGGIKCTPTFLASQSMKPSKPI